ncbi:hypothetical protein NCS52_01581600 [Fusarium sp. LHS14.1]|nr:hypothetical protein NCS52_01581600 [Fusarium sp. LHS14.1]
MGERNSHHISSDEVLNAPGLASKGEQRLRTIVDGEPNHFSFRIAFEDGQWASVEFHILPVASEFAQHPLYAVTGSFTPSHDAVHPSRVLATAQLVYDTYIRVTWLKLSEDLLERRAPVSSSTSHNRGNSEMCRDGSGGRFAPGPPSDAGMTARLPTFTRPATRPRDKDEGDSNTDSQVEGDVDGITSCTESESRETAVSISTQDGMATKPHLDRLIDGLVKKVESGQAKRVKREKRQKNNKEVEVIGVDNVVSQCLLREIDDENLDRYLDRVEKALDQYIQGDKCDVRRRSWTTWFYLACLRIVRELRRKGRKHRPSNGARLANQIVNHLLVTDGVAAMGVYDGLAEHCYKISKAAEATPEDAEYITMNVAAKLHGKVLAPPDSSQIPFPAVWLKSILTKVPYHTICHDIGLPNLAALSLEPQWSTLDGRLVMPLGAPMSLIRKKWSIWVSADPTIQAFRGQLESNVSGMSTASSPNVPHLPGRQHGPIFQSDDLACNGTSPREFTRPNSRGNVDQNDNMTGILAANFGTDWNSQQCLSDLDRVLSDFTMHCDAGFIGFPSA